MLCFIEIFPNTTDILTACSVASAVTRDPQICESEMCIEMKTQYTDDAREQIPAGLTYASDVKTIWHFDQIFPSDVENYTSVFGYVDYSYIFRN